MNNLDQKIRSALDDADRERYEWADEESLLRQVAHTFQSRSRWLVIVVWLAVGLMSALAVFSAVQFFSVEATRDHVLYAALFLFASMGIALLKMWYFMEVNRHAHTRELKRLELQIARLAERDSGKSA